MREAKFTKPITIYVSKETYQKVKAITDERKISMAEWFREATEMALLKSNDKEAAQTFRGFGENY